MERINLQEGWRFAEANSNEWTPVSVPGTVLSGLLEADKMQDPYYRENEYEARELLAKDYVFETDFCISEEQLNKKHCVLVCEGLDTLADVYVNEKLVEKLIICTAPGALTAERHCKRKIIFAFIFTQR